jgi:hypothetical protein
MFIENNLRKKKPEGTFTDPDVPIVSPKSVIDIEEVYDPIVFAAPIIPLPSTHNLLPPRRTTSSPKISSPVREAFRPLTRGGFGTIK